MDNAVRFDSIKMLKNGAKAWSMDQEAVDLNSYLYAEKLWLAKIQETLDGEEQSRNFKEEAEKLKTKIQESMFDEESGYFYDAEIGNEQLVKVKGPEGWIPLWTGVANKSQAAAVKDIVLSNETFSTFVPFPTLDASHPAYSPSKGYWRGDVWLDQAYFGIEGLKRYGYTSEAEELKNRILNNSKGLLESDAPIYENYDPTNGDPLKAPHFSWSAGHLLLLLKNK